MIAIHELVTRVKRLAKDSGKTPTRSECIHAGIVSDWEMRKHSYEDILKLAGLDSHINSPKKAHHKPKILVLDIETAPILAYVWGLFDQNIGLNQIKQDWHLMSWAAKWLGENEVFYQDQRDAKKLEDDKKILKELWKLIDEADYVLGQNSRRFDLKKLNARFLAHGFPPPSSYRHIDTLVMAKKHFGFTSNKLAYMSENFNQKFKKLDHAKYSGFELWNECMKGNRSAWNEMKKYNVQDVRATEELALKFIPWEKSINFNSFSDHFDVVCSCGSISFKEIKVKHENSSRNRRFICNTCGKEHVSKENLLSKEKRKSLMK